MKLLITMLTVILTATNILGQGIKFEKFKSLPFLLAKAREDNKYVFIDTYATWCIPCKEMDLKTFNVPEVGTYFNKKFLSIKVQINRTSQDDTKIKSWYEDARILKEKFNIQAFPTFLLLSPNGNLLKKIEGFQDGNTIINLAKNAIDSNENYLKLVHQFEKHELDTIGMNKLLRKAKEIQDFNVSFLVSEALIRKFDFEKIWTKETLKFIGENLTSKSQYFKVFHNEIAKINSIVYENYAENTIMKLIYREEISPIEHLTTTNWEILKDFIIKKYGVLGEERILGDMMLHYESISDWNNFGKYYKMYFDKAIDHGRSFVHINNVSWSVFENVADTAALNTALRAVEFNIDKYERYDPASIDTWANILYKVGRIEQAIVTEDLARRLSDNGKEFVETLAKMKRGEKLWKH